MTAGSRAPPLARALLGTIERRDRTALGRMTAIKICGITRLEDAERPWRSASTPWDSCCGRKARGTRRSKRSQRIGALLPPFVTQVGVFVRPSAGDVNLAAASGIQLAQIHGDVPALARRAAAGAGDPGRPPRSRWARGDRAAVHGRDDPARRARPGAPRRHRQDHRLDTAPRSSRGSRRVVLAGGLTPANVGAGDSARCGRTAWTWRRASKSSPGVKDRAVDAAVRRAPSRGRR